MNYVWKWGPESAWIAITAVMTYAMTLLTSDFENITDWRKFAIAATAGLIRAILAALLASQTGGFRPGQPTVPTIDEEVGVSPLRRAKPEMPDPPTHPGG